MLHHLLPRALCIVGPTSSGKTALGIALAKKFKGEVINADARQIYRGFNIGTGKPEGRRMSSDGRRFFLVERVPHHLMDFMSPLKVCTVAEWQKKALRFVRTLSDKGKLPILVGGTGLYIQALVDNYRIPSVPPNPAYRGAMESKTLSELVSMLLHVDPEAEKIVDLKNRRRVLRALEVVTFTGRAFSVQRHRDRPVVDALLIGIKRSKEELKERIEMAIDQMILRGWVKEVEKLHRHGVPWNAPAMTSIGYREIGAYLRGEIPLETAIERTKRATGQYTKRQITWFKREGRVHWVKDAAEAARVVKKWMAEVRLNA